MQDNTYADLEAASLEDLKRMASAISMEGLASPEFLLNTRERFRGFFGKAEGFFKTLKFDVIGIGKVNLTGLMKDVNKAGFIDAGKTNVVVPQGFVGEWMPYAEDLYNALKLSGALPRMTKDYNECLGSMISDPMQLKGASGIPYNNKYDVGLAVAMKAITDKYFDPKSESVTRSLGAVVERVSDLIPVMNSINDSATFDRMNPSTIVTKNVGRSMELSRQLLPLLDDDNKVSKPVREQLVALTYSLAREIEAYSMLLYRVRQFKLSIEDSLAKIDL